MEPEYVHWSLITAGCLYGRHQQKNMGQKMTQGVANVTVIYF